MVWSSCNCVKINKPIFVDGIHDLSNDAFHYVRFEHCVVTAHASLHISMNFSGRIRCVGFWNRKPSVRVCFIFFFYSSRCFYIDCSIEAHSEREKKKNMHFFFLLWPARYHSLSIGIVTVGFITSRQNWYVYIYVFIASRCIHRLRRIKSWKK